MFRSKSAEVDPLLPQNDPSPEIQSYGTSKAPGSSEIKYNEPPAYRSDETYDDNNEASSQPDETDPQSRSRSNVLGSIITFLTFAGFFALVLLALSSSDETNGRKSPLLPVPGRGSSNLTFDERVTKILTDTPLIDGHNDLAIFIRSTYKNNIHSSDFRNKFEHGDFGGNVDLPRLKKGMAGGAFWSAFVVCPQNASEDFSDAEYSTAVAHTLQQIDMIRRLQIQYPDKFTFAGDNSVGEMLMRFHSTRAMFGPVSIEGLHQVPQSAAMATLRMYYALGVRAATLTWNCHNAFADAAMVWHNGTNKVAGYHRGGLTEAGREVIREMNRLGMLVDISHTSYWTQQAVLSGGTSRSPVVFTHSSAYALCPHPRNVKDDILELVRDTDSIVMVNFAPDFISCVAGDGDFPDLYPKNNTLHQVARHIVYIGERIGYDHVGIGSDFDGIGEVLPEGLDGVDKFPDLIKELLKMGVSDADASKIVGGNILRVWQAAERVSWQMHRDGEKEGEDEVSGYYRDMI